MSPDVEAALQAAEVLEADERARQLEVAESINRFHYSRGPQEEDERNGEASDNSSPNGESGLGKLTRHH